MRPAFHAMAKPTGSRCNLECACCFFRKKERLYPGSELRIMNVATAGELRERARHAAAGRNRPVPAGPSTRRGIP